MKLASPETAHKPDRNQPGPKNPGHARDTTIAFNWSTFSLHIPESHSAACAPWKRPVLTGQQSHRQTHAIFQSFDPCEEPFQSPIPPGLVPSVLFVQNMSHAPSYLLLGANSAVHTPPSTAKATGSCSPHPTTVSSPTFVGLPFMSASRSPL